MYRSIEVEVFTYSLITTSFTCIHYQHILYRDVKKIQCIVYVQGNIIEKNTMNKSTIKIMYLHTYSIAL